MDQELAFYALTPAAAALARRMAEALGGQVHAVQHLAQAQEVAFINLPQHVASTFGSYRAHIFVCAAGIAVRCIAPHLGHKSTDPAVVVCDEGGRFAVSLLSGHWGGGNALAERVAKVTEATPVLTTGTDVQGLPALDLLAQEAGCSIVDWDKVKLVNASLLRGEKVQISDPAEIMGELAEEYFQRVRLSRDEHADTRLPVLDPARPAVCVDWRAVPAHPNLLRLALPALYVGVGCRRGASCEEILQAIAATLSKGHMEPLALAALASVDVKEEEAGLKEAAQRLGVPLHFFSAEDLSDAPTLTPSAMAAQIFGVDHISVSEGAAILAAGGDDAALLVPKIKYNERVTVAVAAPESLLPPSADIV